MRIQELKYFRKDGKETFPNGVGLYKAAVLNEAYNNRNSFIYQAKYNILILFSEKVNIKLHKIKQDELNILVFSKPFKGHYITSKHSVYNENSQGIYIPSINSDILIKFTEKLCYLLKQKDLIVRDFKTNKIFLIETD